ncbi:hypothetical protein FQN60_007367 [Etheostoma spectabile]|uniref:Transposase Tc1-like domain-containing protein n=1 Tax=Etheostoma spectabile TaxID=54343 RepID=A0A5J5CTM1_9PERO|nr:hypothetical protein FQN60_007367 [Etheostoma spectabile]
MSVSTVQSLIDKWKILGSLNTKPRSGRPRKISAKTAKRIVWDAKKHPQVTSGEIQAALEKDGVVVAMSTIRWYFNTNELHGRVARKKPLLRQCHKKKPAYSEQNTIPTMKYAGGSLMFWEGGATSKGIGNLVKIDGKMNAACVDSSSGIFITEETIL